VVAIARALTLWAAARRLSGRVVNGEGLSDAVAIKETLFAFAALAGGVAFYLLLRRAGDEARRRALTGALAGGAVSALAAVLQVLGLLPGESRAYWGRLGRLSGGAIDPNSLGICCALLLVVAFSRALQPGRRRALSLGLSLLLAAGLALSGSRSGAGMAGLGLLLVLVAPALPARARISAIAALVLVGGAALIALAAGARGNVGARILQTFDPSLPAEFRFSARPLLWRAAGRLFLEHPAAGAGMGVFAWRFPDLIAAEGRSVGARDNPGSGYVQALAETGAVGFLVTAGAVLSLAAQAFRKWRMPDAGSDGPAAGVAVAAFLVALAIGSHWLAADVGLVFFLLAARCGDDAERSSSGQPGVGRAWSGRALAVAVGAYALAATAAILATSDPAETFRYSPRIGFHDLERGPGGAFRWTKQRFALRVSPGDAPLRLGLANFGPSGAPVTLEARSGDHSPPAVRRTLRPGGATALWIAPGTSPAVVTFALDRSFVPRRLGVSADRRRLGLLSTSSADAMGR
jgi:O-antigen ligase